MAGQKTGIERQIQLPFSMAVAISRNNIVHRFGRCAITIAGIGLGVAFLCYVIGWQAVINAQAEVGEAGFGGVEKSHQIWLISISFLTCIVGVTNAMLMSVTERYKEIGTMKCLGALDSFVVRLFLLEASFQGLVGAVSGWLISFLLLAAVGLSKFGGSAFRHFPIMQFLGIFGLGLLAGMFLSIVGAIYPAWRAGKMPPAEAMRVEV